MSARPSTIAQSLASRDARIKLAVDENLSLVRNEVDRLSSPKLPYEARRELESRTVEALSSWLRGFDADYEVPLLASAGFVVGFLVGLLGGEA